MPIGGFQPVFNAFRVRGPEDADYNYPSNSNQSLSCDRNGNLYVTEATPPVANIWNDTNYAASALVFNGANVLAQVGGFNDGVTAYLLLFDAAALPANGTAAMQSFLVPAGASFAWMPPFGRRLATGLYYAASTTPNVLTLAASVFWLFGEGTFEP